MSTLTQVHMYLHTCTHTYLKMYTHTHKVATETTKGEARERWAVKA